MKFMVGLNFYTYIQLYNLSSKVFLIAYLAIILSVVDCAPFNAVVPFYNGDAASAPSFDIKVNVVSKK